MSEFQTLQVGSLELRKTAEGWQYLCKGKDNEPEYWWDATTLLAPFGGSGLSSVLDELLAARQEAEQKAERVCKNCRYWGQIYEGCCDFIDTIAGERVAATTGCQIIATVSDDSGLNTLLKTGPNFSCPNFSK
ncbi:TPA: hypothetical protein R1W95_001051 [Pseudomonas aeruginosa]|nr:hypothetical protein [Pseudomonas aeruginosa]